MKEPVVTREPTNEELKNHIALVQSYNRQMIAQVQAGKKCYEALSVMSRENQIPIDYTYQTDDAIDAWQSANNPPKKEDGR